MTRQSILMTLGVIAIGVAMVALLIGANPFSEDPPPAQEPKLKIEAQ